jgi:predicted ATPase
MITEWRIEHFKSVGQQTILPLRPLTVMTGPNSSGKSTVLQSMLLICQTLASKVLHRQIILNGELIKLGTFADVLTDGANIDEINLGFTVQADLSETEYDWRSVSSRRSSRIWYINPMPFEGDFRIDLSYEPRKPAVDETSSKSLTLQGQLKNATFSASLNQKGISAPDEHPFGGNVQQLQLKRRTDVEKRALMKSIGISPRDESSERQGLEYAVVHSPNQSQTPWTWPHYQYAANAIYDLDFIGVQLEHFLPGIMVVRDSKIRRQVIDCLFEMAERQNLEHAGNSDQTHRIVSETLKEEAAESQKEILDFMRRLRRLPQRDTGRTAQNIQVKLVIEKACSRLSRQMNETVGMDYVPLPTFLEMFNRIVDGTFAKLKYLGPLRDDPRALYSLPTSADPTHIGYKGEYTAAVLDLYGSSQVEFSAPEGSSNIIRMPLKDAVKFWLQYFGIAENCFTHEEGKLGHRLLIKSSGIAKVLDLTNVGVGVSQVLPIIVMSLISAPGATLLFEQPELHLHPKVQSMLADFFMSMVRIGRQCVVETHSEYLVNRLRLRVAESPWGSSLKDQIQIYFVEQSGAYSRFLNVNINDYGAVPEWPDGFFDQGPSESDRIVFAAANKRKTRPMQGY